MHFSAGTVLTTIYTKFAWDFVKFKIGAGTTLSNGAIYDEFSDQKALEKWEKKKSGDMILV